MYPYQSLKNYVSLTEQGFGMHSKYLASPNEVQICIQQVTSRYGTMAYFLFFISLLSVRETASEVTALACSSGFFFTIHFYCF